MRFSDLEECLADLEKLTNVRSPDICSLGIRYSPEAQIQGEMHKVHSGFKLVMQ
jgi:hypothetical protein